MAHRARYDNSTPRNYNSGSYHQNHQPQYTGYNSYSRGPPRGNHNNPHGHYQTTRTNWQKPQKKEYESDPHRLAQRQKQIMYGENTPGYHNFIKLLEKDQSLLKGCLPVKPSINQKCSKRSWDGQVRKWRRALHMYDFVDFGESEEQSLKVKEALVEQNRNPLFSPSPKKTVVIDGEEQEVALTSSPVKPIIAAAKGEVSLPTDVDPTGLPRVRYTFEDLLKMGNSPLISENINLPEPLFWLDKRVDLEDEFEDDMTDTTSCIASPYSSRYSASSTPMMTPMRPLFTPKTDRASRKPPEEFVFTPPTRGSRSATNSPSAHRREPRTKLDWDILELVDKKGNGCIPVPTSNNQSNSWVHTIEVICQPNSTNSENIPIVVVDKENCLNYSSRAPPATPPPRTRPNPDMTTSILSSFCKQPLTPQPNRAIPC